MLVLFRWASVVTIILLQSLYAVSPEQAIDACIANQGNRMGPELCECVIKHKVKPNTSDEEFDFYYAIAAKDQQKIAKYNTTLDANQKINVMTLYMKAPSECAGELANQENSSDQPESSTDSAVSASDSASEAASGATSQ